MVIESKRYEEKAEEIISRRVKEIQEAEKKIENLKKSMSLLTESMQRYTDDSLTSDNLLKELIDVLNKYGIRGPIRLKEVLECLYTLLTV